MATDIKNMAMATAMVMVTERRYTEKRNKGNHEFLVRFFLFRRIVQNLMTIKVLNHTKNYINHQSRCQNLLFLFWY
jgi:hypothetical protein